MTRFSQTSLHAHQMWCRTYQAPHWMPGCRWTWYLVGFRCLHPHHNQQRCSPCPFRMRRKDRHNHKFHYTISTLKRIKKTRNYSPTGTKCIILEENVRIMYCQLYKSSSSFGTRLWNCLHILIGISLRKACFKDKFINCSSLYSGLRMIYVDTTLHDLVEIRKSNYNLRGDKILTLPKVNTTKYGLKSLRYEGANLWNKLPNEYRKADSYKLFKKQILDTDLAGRYMS